MTKQEVKQMIELTNRDRQTRVIVDQFDLYDWEELYQREPKGYSWREEAHIAGEEYIEQDKEYLRSN
jgi:hypothetical protein